MTTQASSTSHQLSQYVGWWRFGDYYFLHHALPSPSTTEPNRSIIMLSFYHSSRSKKTEKVGFDDSTRSGATDLDLSSSNRYGAEFDSHHLFFFNDDDDKQQLKSCLATNDDKQKLKSCLVVKTQAESLMRQSLDYAPISASTRQEAFRRSSTSSSSLISFDKVQIRSYDIIITDNPSTTCGPPVGLGWTHSDTEECYDIDNYEDCRGPPRSKDELTMPSSVRYEMLRLAGCSRNSLQKASANVKEQRAKRKKTLRSYRRKERVESFASAIKSIIASRATKAGYQ